MTTKSQIHLYKRIGLVIKIRRKAVMVSQEELGQKSGVTRAQIANLESGRSGVTIHTLSGVAKALRIKVWEILKDSAI